MKLILYNKEKIKDVFPKPQEEKLSNTFKALTTRPPRYRSKFRIIYYNDKRIEGLRLNGLLWLVLLYKEATQAEDISKGSDTTGLS